MSDIAQWGAGDPLASLMPSWSPYAYAFANPVRYIDPDGRFPSPYRVAPGSGNHWSDGVGRSDWSLHKGSDSYRADLAYIRQNGGSQVGGNFYTGSGGFIAQQNGESGVWVDYYTYGIKDFDHYIDSEFSPLGAQQGGPGDPPGNSSANNGFPLSTVAGGVMSSFGLGTDISLHQITKGGTQVKLAQKGAYIGAKSLSTKLGVAGLAVTGYDIYDQGLNTSRSLDVVMGGVAFIPGVGWAISGTYFVSNLITIGITGQSIGDHLQGAVTGQDGTKAWKPWGD